MLLVANRAPAPAPGVERSIPVAGTELAEIWPTETISATDIPAGVTFGVEALSSDRGSSHVAPVAEVAATSLADGGYPVWARERETLIEFRTQSYDMGRPTLLESRIQEDIWLYQLANAEAVLPVPYIPIALSVGSPAPWYADQANAGALGLQFVAPGTQIMA